LEHTIGIKPSLVVILLNIPLFVTAYKLFGKEFIKSSVLGTVVFSLALEFSNIFVFSGDFIVICIAGSVLTGFGMGIVLMNESTTGGTDIAARILELYFPNFSVGKLILAVDGSIAALSAIIFRNFELAVYAAIALYISSVIVDRLVEGVDFAKATYIISSKSTDISENILTKMQRGVTGFKGAGMYSKKDTIILLCIVKNYELATLKKCIFEIDSNAFLITADVREVMGKGFRLL